MDHVQLAAAQARRRSPAEGVERDATHAATENCILVLVRSTGLVLYQYVFGRFCMHRSRLQCAYFLSIDPPFEASYCMNGTPHPTHWGDPTLWAKANIQMQTKRYSYATRAVCHSPPRRPPPIDQIFALSASSTRPPLSPISFGLASCSRVRP